MKDDKRISPCDLVAALYHEGGEENSPYLALLKLDPSSAFQNRITRAGGQRVVNLEEINLIFTTERLQKAALIQTIDPKNMYDLLLLDSQAGLYKGGQVAEFFRETFLDCDFAYDSKELTKELYSALLTVENNLLWGGLTSDSKKFSRILLDTLLGQNFNLQEWYPNLPLSKKAQGIVSEVFETQLHSQVFEIDGNQARKFSQKAVFVGSNGLKIEVNAGSIDKVEYVYVPAEPLKPAHWEIKIKTQNLERVK